MICLFIKPPSCKKDTMVLANQNEEKFFPTWMTFHKTLKLSEIELWLICFVVWGLKINLVQWCPGDTHIMVQTQTIE